MDDPAAAAQKLRETATAFDGFVTSEYVVLPTAAEGQVSRSRSQVTLSVPADRFDAAMDDAAKAVTVVSRSVSSADVTTQVVDVDARVRTLRDSIARLQELMSRAGTLTEIAALEAELTKRQADLESLLAQQEALRNQVARSPITVTLLTSAQARVEARAGRRLVGLHPVPADTGDRVGGGVALPRGRGSNRATGGLVGPSAPHTSDAYAPRRCCGPDPGGGRHGEGQRAGLGRSAVIGRQVEAAVI